MLALVGAAFAGSGAGPNKSSSSISDPIVVSTTASPTTGGPRFGETVTLDVSTTATTTPFVNLNCYQNGALVAQSLATFVAGGSPGTELTQ